MEIHYKIIGSILILLALIHVFFPKYFQWDKELKMLSLINREMMIVHTFFIALIVFLMGLLCLLSATELIDTQLGKTVSLGMGLFWAFRLVIQLFVYSPELWKGKKFETAVHILFTLTWIYFAFVFLWVGLGF